MKYEVRLSSQERVIIEAFRVTTQGDFVVFEDNSHQATCAVFRPVAVIREGTVPGSVE